MEEDDRIRIFSRIVGLEAYDNELLKTILTMIDEGIVTEEESKKFGEIRKIAYEKAKKRLEEGV